MARYTEAVCKLCRREGQKLFLKGQRCYTDKCAINRRAYAPGQHGQNLVQFQRSDGTGLNSHRHTPFLLKSWCINGK